MGYVQYSDYCQYQDGHSLPESQAYTQQQHIESAPQVLLFNPMKSNIRDSPRYELRPAHTDIHHEV